MKARRRLYLDTSAYLRIVLGEDGSDRLSAETDRADLVSSVLLVLEARRTLTRLAREAVITPEVFQTCLNQLEQDIAAFELRDLTLDLCVSPTMPAVSTPRSLDLVHIRTALWFHGVEPLTRFVTVDAAQAQGARELGLPV